MKQVSFISNPSLSYFTGESGNRTPHDLTIEQLLNMPVYHELEKIVYNGDVVISFDLFEESDPDKVGFMLVKWNGITIGKYFGTFFADGHHEIELDQIF